MSTLWYYLLVFQHAWWVSFLPFFFKEYGAYKFGCFSFILYMFLFCALILGTIRNMMKQNLRALRMHGSACNQLAAVACGRTNCFYECGPHPWDVCAGNRLYFIKLAYSCNTSIAYFFGTCVWSFSVMVCFVIKCWNEGMFVDNISYQLWGRQCMICQSTFIAHTYSTPFSLLFYTI